MSSRPDIWMKKSYLYGTKLMSLLRRGDTVNITASSGFRISEFLFPAADDEDKRHINGFLTSEGMFNLLKKMIDLKKEFKQQRGHINRYLQQLTLSHYENYKRNPSKSLHVTVRNIDTNGNLINDGSIKIADVIKMIENVVKSEILSVSNKESFKTKIDDFTIEKAITLSIESQFYWKNTDVSMHSLGSPMDIANLIIRIVNSPTLGRTSDTKFINMLFLPYIASKDHEGFKKSVSDIKGLSAEFKYPKEGEDKFGTYTLPDLLTRVKTLTDAEGTSSNNGHKEFLIIFLVNVLSTVERVYKDILKLLKDTYAKDDTKLHFNLEKSIQALVVFFNNAVKNYFNIDSLYTPYGFAKSRSNKPAGTGNITESANKEGIIRVIGNMDVVKDVSKFGATFPIQITKRTVAGADKFEALGITNLVEMFLGKQNGLKDAKTDKPIYMGGFIMKSPIDTLSVKILTSYFKSKLKAKERYIKVIEEIIHNSGNYVSINDIQKIKNDIFLDLDNVATYTNPELRNTAFKTILNEIIRKYLKYRDAELQDLMATARFSAMMKRYNISKPDNAEAMKRILEISDDTKIENIVEEVMDAKENLIVRLGYHQIMAIAQRVLSIRILSIIQLEMGPERIPNQYISLMKSGFDKADQVILKKVAELKSGSVEFIRNKLKSSMNIPNLDINDIGLGLGLNRPRRNRKNNVGNLSMFGNLMMMGNAEKPEFWDNLTEQLKGYTLYIPYVEKGVSLSAGGLFNLLEAAKDGKMAGKHFISDYNLTESKYTNELRLQGYIIVAEQETELKKPALWRAIEKKQLSDARKLSVKDLRIYLYNMLFSEVMYKRRVNQLWSDGAKGKTNLVKYCMKLASNRRGCPILISREKVAGMV